MLMCMYSMATHKDVGGGGCVTLSLRHYVLHNNVHVSQYKCLIHPQFEHLHRISVVSRSKTTTTNMHGSGQWGTLQWASMQLSLNATFFHNCMYRIIGYQMGNWRSFGYCRIMLDKCEIDTHENFRCTTHIIRQLINRGLSKIIYLEHGPRLKCKHLAPLY